MTQYYTFVNLFFLLILRLLLIIGLKTGLIIELNEIHNKVKLPDLHGSNQAQKNPV
jgi:predicted transporter